MDLRSLKQSITELDLMNRILMIRKIRERRRAYKPKPITRKKKVAAPPSKEDMMKAINKMAPDQQLALLRMLGGE